MDRDKIILGIFELIFTIFAVIFIIQLLLKITGHSPVEHQLIYVALGIIITYLIGSNYTRGIFVGEVREFMKTTKNSFALLREDIKELKARKP